MIYEYFCDECKMGTEIVKMVTDYARDERCPVCGENMKKIYSSTHLIGLNDKAEYNQALGMVIRNRAHLKQVAKEKNLVEVGTESTDTIVKEMKKTKENKYKQSWDSV
jgi:putative FmdB family regulatory protein